MCVEPMQAHLMVMNYFNSFPSSSYMCLSSHLYLVTGYMSSRVTLTCLYISNFFYFHFVSLCLIPPIFFYVWLLAFFYFPFLLLSLFHISYPRPSTYVSFLFSFSSLFRIYFSFPLLYTYRPSLQWFFLSSCLCGKATKVAPPLCRPSVCTNATIRGPLLDSHFSWFFFKFYKTCTDIWSFIQTRSFLHAVTHSSAEV